MLKQKTPAYVGVFNQTKRLVSAELNETSLHCFHGNPHALYLAGRKFHATALYVRTENALGLLDELEADAAALLGLTLVNDVATLDRALAGDGADA